MAHLVQEVQFFSLGCLIKGLSVIKLLAVTDQHICVKNNLSFLRTEWTLMLMIYTK